MQVTGAESMIDPNCSRFLVLVPDSDVDEPRLSQYLWQSMAGRRIEVHIVCAAINHPNQARAELRLALLIALLRQEGVQVSHTTSFALDWIETIRGVGYVLRAK